MATAATAAWGTSSCLATTGTSSGGAGTGAESRLLWGEVLLTPLPGQSGSRLGVESDGWTTGGRRLGSLQYLPFHLVPGEPGLQEDPRPK